MAINSNASGVPFDPNRQSLFVERSRRKGNHGLNGVHGSGLQAFPVNGQKKSDAEECGSLVSSGPTLRNGGSVK
jgi:hypothetical protein